MTTPLKGKKYRMTLVVTYEGRTDSDGVAIEMANEVAEVMKSYQDEEIRCQRILILRVDRYNGNKPATRIFPDPKHDGLLAIEEVVSYILDTESEDRITDDAPDNVFTQAVKITNNFLRKI